MQGTSCWSGWLRRCATRFARPTRWLGFATTRGEDLPTSLESVLSLAELVDVNQMGSARHSQVVGHYAEAMAEKLGLYPDDVQRLRLAGVLHDVGKIGVRGSILAKPGPLTEEEM